VDGQTIHIEYFQIALKKIINQITIIKFGECSFPLLLRQHHPGMVDGALTNQIENKNGFLHLLLLS